MTKTYAIKRADLKAKNYKAYALTKKGALPKKRDIELIANVLKIMLTK